ncbi:hypothetical protein BTW28_04095 [Citrobacter freundii]|nr:hypothetical protein BTW28_04095 [Citrobacter freundii]
MVCLMFVESKAVVYPNLRAGGLRKLALYLDFTWRKAESLEQFIHMHSNLFIFIILFVLVFIILNIDVFICLARNITLDYLFFIYLNAR